ncbi:leucine-rich repeat-containing protein kinase family protein [Paraburkholderia domus]|uniref:Protein kinase domain-containing protein n=1 Tax=Paraburkholderia domus TaxID=2793075 RepID=A0A9N8MKM9_9BURK|nr:leucine-rich repeat-containing protein kinase family protein [Paraburkholderia domus]MBK5049212.1 serine/threonine-protein kinase [Burkholderia sp. R-70006]MBK5060181.1 serine/threonine-protein kinase [Burkholderia sp. R-70199]MBK5118445.1 serine/threonine-protein kinase [Burkholderia sp. R-69980]MBK5164283.1 serine/threonine-protein kinase [Burkholderia sp. R-70211]MBK5179680.1 serine/threonine-protein kinase [Burkholderia sp. R-69749]
MTSTLEQLRAGQLAGTRRLKLACGLSEFPREIFDLADTLEILDLSGNALSTLPDDLPRLSKLHTIFASDNPFTELPEVLGACSQLSMVGFKANRIREVSGKSLPPLLRWLILTDNEIEALPPEIGACAQLQKLMLAGNRLRTLPEELSACSRLELLRLAANQLSGLPAWLLRLPRLSWLAFAGNSFSETLETAALSDTPIADIRWDELKLEQQLGEGASGVIYRAALLAHDDDASRPVAVKLFKGAVTSDGLPDCEMAACIRAGDHPNLIPVVGKVKDHPADAHGLVMELIDPQFTNLAGPPSLESCTRDVYGADTRFDLASALSIAYGMASAACHLHRQGVIHGDLYAHNILHCGQGRALLGDFGAASFYATDDRDLSAALQRLEVRAYGCLLEELIDRCDWPNAEADIAAKLVALKQNCLSEDIGSRPLFDEIASVLRQLMGTGNRDAAASASG